MILKLKTFIKIATILKEHAAYLLALLNSIYFKYHVIKNVFSVYL